MIYMLTREFKPIKRKLMGKDKQLMQMVDQSEMELIQIEQAIEIHGHDPKALRKVSLHLTAKLQANLEKMRRTIK